MAFHVLRRKRRFSACPKPAWLVPWDTRRALHNPKRGKACSLLSFGGCCKRGSTKASCTHWFSVLYPDTQIISHHICRSLPIFPLLALLPNQPYLTFLSATNRHKGCISPTRQHFLPFALLQACPSLSLHAPASVLLPSNRDKAASLGTACHFPLSSGTESAT